MNLRRLGIASIAALLVQLLLGMSVNLWVTIGTPRPWSHISDVALVAVHGVLGVAIMLLSLFVLTAAFETPARGCRVASVAALLGVLAALGCGVGFVSSGGSAGFSFGMTVGWVVAVTSDVYLIAASRPASTASSTD